MADGASPTRIQPQLRVQADPSARSECPVHSLLAGLAAREAAMSTWAFRAALVIAAEVNGLVQSSPLPVATQAAAGDVGLPDDLLSVCRRDNRSDGPPVMHSAGRAAEDGDDAHHDREDRPCQKCPAWEMASESESMRRGHLGVIRIRICRLEEDAQLQILGNGSHS